MDFEDQDEQEEEMDLHHNQESYESPPHPIKTAASPVDTVGTAGIPLRNRPRYRECLKNHAVGIGGHAVDGCGEFMAAGADGTLDGLRCAACGCHRNFHRKDTDLPLLLGPPARHALAPHHHGPPGGYYRAPPPPLQLALPPPPVARDEYGEGVDASGSGSGSLRKRFRTKFTGEQKEKMLVLAEKIGWRIQKQDEEIVQRFCEETGVKRQVLKVWLHNNKHTLGKRQPTPD